MKKIILSISLLVEGVFIQAQLQNPGFEKEESSFPVNWSSKPNDAYEIKIDPLIKHSGTSSLLLSSKSPEEKGRKSFFQTVNIPGSGLRKLQINAYIKSEKTAGNVDIWCQVRGENKKYLNIGNFNNQSNKVILKDDWKKYSLEFIVDDKDSKNFVVGGQLIGGGKAWFDDFSITEIPFSQNPSSQIALTYIDEFKNIVKSNSIFKDKIDWSTLETNLHKLSRGMETIQDTDPAIQYIMKTLSNVGDDHSLIDNKQFSEEKKSNKSAPVEPEYKLLNKNIGYIMVPRFSSMNEKVINAFAQKIQNMIKQLDSENNIKGWIVDLRNNQGGNMNPMIVGLGPLTGEGSLGYFVMDANNKFPWYYEDGQTNGAKISEPYKLKKPDQKIAVLIGPSTASSGEVVTISFIGKSNAKTFGQPSAGYTSANRNFDLSDGKTLYLASSYEMDRTGKEYKGKIEPDVLITPSTDKNVDAEIQKASEWILE